MFLLYAGLIAGNLVVTRTFATQRAGMAAAFDYCMRCVNVVMAYLVYPVPRRWCPRLRGCAERMRRPKAYALIDRESGADGGCGGAFLRGGRDAGTPVIALLFQRGNFTPESTQLVSAVFLGFAPSLIGWAMLELIARCFFALDRPRLPLMAAFIPITVNLDCYVGPARGRKTD